MGNEERVLHLLKKKMKATGAATYLPDFPILKPREQRVKMRLVLGTHSTKGLEVFRDVQYKVERSEIETRNQLSREGDFQISLFADDEVTALQQNSAGVGCPRFQREAEARVTNLLRDGKGIRFDTIATDVLETVPIRLTQLNTLANEMKRREVISFDLPPLKRVPQPDTVMRLA